MKLVETEQDIYSVCSHKSDTQGISLLRLQKDKQEKECYFRQWHLSLFRLFGEWIKLCYVGVIIDELQAQDVELNNKWKTENEEWN